MSKAAKCDKCGLLFELDGAHFNTEGWRVGWKPGAGWFPKKMDLCSSCAAAFGKAVSAWWKIEELSEEPKEL